MTREELIRKAAEFDYWHYPYDLGDGKKIYPVNTDYDHIQPLKAEHLLSSALEIISHGDLKELSVLDCGCNSGFFSFECAKKGAAKVVGVESKEEFLKQAVLLNSFFRFDNVKFEKKDISMVTAKNMGTFDIVLAMGIIEYLTDPAGFLRNVYEISKGYLILESLTMPMESPFLHVRIFSKAPHYPAAGDTHLNFVPSIGALKRLLFYAGFRAYMYLKIHDIHEEYKIKERVGLLVCKDEKDGFISLNSEIAEKEDNDWGEALSRSLSLREQVKDRIKRVVKKYRR